MLPVIGTWPRPAGGVGCRIAGVRRARRPRRLVRPRLAREFEHRVGYFAEKVAREFMLGSRWPMSSNPRILGARQGAGSRRPARAIRSSRLRVPAHPGSHHRRGPPLPPADATGGCAGCDPRKRRQERRHGCCDRALRRRSDRSGATPEEIAGRRRLRRRLDRALGAWSPRSRAASRLHGRVEPARDSASGRPSDRERPRALRAADAAPSRAHLPHPTDGLHANR